jgi:phosphatidylglycerophosphate synthase
MSESSTTTAVFDVRGSHRPKAAGGALAKVGGLPILVRNLLVLQRRGFQRALIVVHPDDAPRISGELRRYPQLHLSWSCLEDAGESVDLRSCLDERDRKPGVNIWPGSLSFGRSLPRASASGESASLFISRLYPGGQVSPIGLAEGPVMVRDECSRRQAERALLNSLRKNADGAVAKIDRYVSLAISRQLMRLPVRPNHVTIAAAILGIACGVLASHGGYGWMLAGALGFQLNSIFDGIDGEIARSKFLESRLGQWLDTVADDITNLSFMLGASAGCFRTWHQSRYLYLGLVAAGGFLIASGFMYHYLITRARSGDLNDFRMPWERSGDVSAPGRLTRLLDRFKWIVRRDMYIFLSTVFALAGQLRVMLWLFAAGATVTWTSIAAYRVAGLLPSRQGRAP